MDPGWLEDVYLATDRLFVTRLGPEISTAAKAYCPVLGGQNSTAKASSIAAAERAGVTPGALRDSIRFYLLVHSLIVKASGDGQRTYAAFVELGHRVVAWGKPMGYSKGPQAFLRPALYTVRTAA
jgi:hypothetical protein